MSGPKLYACHFPLLQGLQGNFPMLSARGQTAVDNLFREHPRCVPLKRHLFKLAPHPPKRKYQEPLRERGNDIQGI